MGTYATWIVIGGLAVASATPVIARADSVKLHRDDVIPVIMQTELKFDRTHAGDHFKAEVADSHMLPWGSRLEGVVNRVEPKRDGESAYMDIEFTSILLPDGHHVSFHGTPIPLSKSYVSQDKYGRWEAKKGVSKTTVVLGATAGGLVLGSLVNKPFEGAFIGALVGILAGETDKQDIGDGNMVIPAGTKVGARVDRELTIDFNGDWDNQGANDDRYGPYGKDGFNKDGYDRYGYDRNGHYDSNYDGTRGSRGEQSNPSRNDSDQDRDASSSDYDKYGFDKDGRYNAKYDTTRGAHKGDDSSESLRLQIDGKDLRYDGKAQPFRSGWIIMVPVKETAQQLGYRVSADDTEGSIRLEDDDNVLVLIQDSRSYRLNRKTGSLPVEMSTQDGVAYVPIDAFTMMVKGPVLVNGNKYRPGT